MVRSLKLSFGNAFYLITVRDQGKENANISEGLHYLNTSYASWFIAKYFPLKEVCRLFDINYTNISASVKRFEKKWAKIKR
jgi:hypothetical protein